VKKNTFSQKCVKNIIKSAKIIFWDFDGVIKESSEVKTEGFKNLFRSFNKDIVDRILEHHRNNQGVSRNEKIKLYLNWIGLSREVTILDKFCNEYGKLVYQSVLNSPWVPGIYNYIVNNYKNQRFIIVSATPEAELLNILIELKFNQYFVKIYGSPSSKDESLRSSLQYFCIDASESIFIGDAQADLDAANNNNIPFILRKTLTNMSVQNSYNGICIADLNFS